MMIRLQIYATITLIYLLTYRNKYMIFTEPFSELITVVCCSGKTRAGSSPPQKKPNSAAQPHLDVVFKSLWCVSLKLVSKWNIMGCLQSTESGRKDHTEANHQDLILFSMCGLVVAEKDHTEANHQDLIQGERVSNCSFFHVWFI